MIKQLIEEHAPLVQAPKDINPAALLWAIYFCEKYTKGNRVPRLEAAYQPKGYYYEHSEAVRAEYERWGDYAACSYSNFQILYVTARELGFQGPPLALDRDSVAIRFVVELLNRRIFGRGAKTVEQVADAYNSGSFRDQHQPIAYIQKFVKFYEKANANKL